MKFTLWMYLDPLYLLAQTKICAWSRKLCWGALAHTLTATHCWFLNRSSPLYSALQIVTNISSTATVYWLEDVRRGPVVLNDFGREPPKFSLPTLQGEKGGPGGPRWSPFRACYVWVSLCSFTSREVLSLVYLLLRPCSVLWAVSNAWSTIVKHINKLSWAKNTLCLIIYLLSYIICSLDQLFGMVPWEVPWEREREKCKSNHALWLLPQSWSTEKVCLSQDSWPKFRAPTLVWSQEKHIQMSAVCLGGCFSKLGCFIVWSDLCQTT